MKLPKKMVWSVCAGCFIKGGGTLSFDKSCRVVQLLSKKFPKGVHWYCKLLSLLLNLAENEEEGLKKATDHPHPWSSHHIKVATSMAVAVARKRPDMWLRTICVLLEIMEREIQSKELKKETVEGGKDGGVEPTIVQSLLKLINTRLTWFSAGIDTGVLHHSLKNWISSCELIIRNRFDSARHLSLVASLLKLSSSDEDSNGVKMVMLETDKKSEKEILVDLLVAIAEQCPHVLHDSNHYSILLGAYSATLSRTDTGLLYLISLYEKAGVPIARFSPYMWGSGAVELYGERQKRNWLLWQQPSMVEILSLVDRAIMRSSVSWFPTNQLLEPINPFHTSSLNTSNNDKYDPSFFLPLFSHLLDSSCVVDCLRFVDHGCFAFLLASITSEQEEVRRAGYHCLSRFLSHLEAARLREKSQLLMLVDVLRNTIHREAMRLPTVFAAFVARAAFLFLHPEHEIFPVVAYTVVYKPFLELRDLPLYATLIHSSNTTQGHQERQWLLELLLDGLRCSSDYHLYKKKGVLPHLMVLHESPFVNKKTKTLILHFLLKACAIPSAAVDLVWNHGFLPWLQSAISSTSQVQHCSSLLVNIVTVLQQTLSKCDYRRETNEGEEEDSNSSGCVTSLTKIPLLEEDMALVVSHLTQLQTTHKHSTKLLST